MRTEITENGSAPLYGSYRGRSYIRYSDHKQDDGFSVEYQIAEIEEYCERHNIEIMHHHIDQAQTATKVAGREEFFRLIEAVKAGDVDTIVIYKLNRMFRNSYESQKYRNLFRKHGVKLVSVTQHLDEDTSSGRLTANILSNIDQFQSETISDHVKSSMREMARQGYFTGGRVPYGFQLEETKHGSKSRKKYVINETEAQVVREIFGLYAEGHSMHYIYEHLKEKQIKTRNGSHFVTPTITRMLGYDIYIGTVRYKTKGYDPIIMENAVPAIISKQLWDNVQELKLSKRMFISPRRRNSLYPLTGKTECARCGAHFFGMRTSQNHPNGQRYESQYYICSNSKVYRTCGCKRINKTKLENIVLAEIKRNVLNEKDMERIAHEIIFQLADQPASITDEIKKLEKRQKWIYATLDELLQMRLDREMSPAILRRKSAEYEEELAGITKRLFTLSEQKRHSITFGSVLEYLKQLLEYSRSDNEEVLKLLFDNIVEKIIIDNDRAEIYLRVYPRQNFAYKHTKGLPNVTLYAKVQR
ncbi:MAG: recombinase family protein [Clostridia bacterium]|nr:recombinase family protein [Clostridia bacterium]